MAILHAIVHQLTVNDLSPALQLSSETLNDQAGLSALFQDARSQYFSRANKLYGQPADTNTAFRALTEGYLGQTLGFIEYSHKLMSELQESYASQKIDAEGHWLLVHETTVQEDKLWWFHLKHRTGTYFDHQLALNEGQLLDMAKLGFAFCLSLPQNDSHRVLHQPGLQNLTLSFGFGDKAQQRLLTELVAFVPLLDTQADTQKFLSAVSAYTETLPADTAVNYRKEAVAYCLQQDQAGEPVAYEALSSALDDEDRLSQFIEETQPSLEKSFIPNRAQLKKYMRFSGKNLTVSISFTNETLGKNVEFHPDNETLVIRDLPAALLKQLKQQFQSSQ